MAVVLHIGLTFWVILLGVSPYKQDPHNRLLRLVEESNRIKIAARTKQRLQKPFTNVFGREISGAIEDVLCLVHCISRFVVGV